MRALLPVPDEPAITAPQASATHSAYDLYHPPQRTWLRTNMVLSVDGAIVDPQGRSGGLGGPGDRAMFSALRALADAVVVGAGTVRAEGYGPHRPRAELRARRVADGRPESAPIVVVTRSARLDYASALFTRAEQPTVVLTCAGAAPDLHRAAADAGRLLVAGEDEVDLVAGLALLRDLGLQGLLCEGGPQLNGSLIAAGLVDELCTTVAPLLAPGPSPRYLEGLEGITQLELTGVVEHDGELFLRHGVRGLDQNSRSSRDSSPRSVS